MELMQKMLDDLIALVRINSVEDTSTAKPGQPFGAGVAEVFRLITTWAKRDHFIVDECDGYALEVTAGTSGPLIMLLAHADVVPAPASAFMPFIENEIIHGRGVQDDKGPLVASYYALKAVRDAGLLNDCRVRLVVGGNEESGSACLKYYFNQLKKEIPVFAFSPDADFPLIYGEKGIINVGIKVMLDNSRILTLSGGEAHNSVAASATAKVSSSDLAPLTLEPGLLGEIKDNVITITGKSAHGATPELGRNALAGLFKYLAPLEPRLNRLLATSDHTGSALGINAFGPELKHLTVNLGKAHLEGNELKVTINIRYPETTSLETITAALNRQFGQENISILAHAPLHLVPPTNLGVQLLVDSYRSVTGDLTPPFTIGGGTYARLLPGSVAFGMLFPTTPSSMHEADESLPCADLKRGYQVYYEAIRSLCAHGIKLTQAKS